MIKQTESFLIDERVSSPKRMTILSKPFNDGVPQFQYDHGKSLVCGDELLIEIILGEHNQYKRHYMAAIINKDISLGGKTNEKSNTIDKFMNSNVDHESNQERLVVNLVRKKNLHVIEESENRQSTDVFEENINSPLKQQRSEHVKMSEPIASFEKKKKANTLEVGSNEF